MIGTTISHYRILAPLGSGGMGVVYEAEDTRLGRRVAIKFLPEAAYRDPEAVQRFLREARVVSSLNHPHICTLHDIGEHELPPGAAAAPESPQRRQFMVMELLEGQTLKARIARGAIPLDEVLSLGGQMADALDAAHAKGIVHRDLKPANLFLTGRGQIKVLDFGVAKLSDPAGGRGGAGSEETLGGPNQLTITGSTVGTIAYMSPEQARGQEIDARSDLFSLGVVLFEMATGAPPFPGSTPAVVFEGILTKAPLPPSQLALGVTTDFDRVVSRALEKDRETRYQSAADVRADLKRLSRASESGLTAAAAATAPAVAATPPATAAPSAVLTSAHAEPAGRSRLAWMLGAPAVSVAVVAGLLLWRSSATPALTEADSVVLADFTNRTGDAMFDGTLSEALGGQLRQSTFVKVYPEQQVQATLRLMGQDPMAPITPEIGRDLCQRLGGKALLGGSIAAIGSSYLLSLSAQDCVTGAIVAEEQAQAADKDGVLKALGEASSAFRMKLGESLASVARNDARIEMATTPSLDALKAYSQGMSERRIKGDTPSIPFFQRALELDPDFALAHARISTVYSNLGQAEEAKRHVTRAYELRNRVSDRERYYIEARYHTTVAQNVEDAMAAYRRLLAAFPGDYAAHSNLAQLQRQQGDTAGAIANYEAAIRVAPDQPLPLQNLGSAYIDVGRYADARRVFEEALKIQDAATSRTGLHAVAVLTGDRALADAQVEAMRGRPEEGRLTTQRLSTLAYQGRMTEAAALVPDFLRHAEQAKRMQFAGEALTDLAINEAVVGLESRARERLADLRRRKLVNAEAADEQLVVAAIVEDSSIASAAMAEALKLIAAGPADGRETAERSLRVMEALAARDPAKAARLLEPLTFELRRTNQAILYAVSLQRSGRSAEAAKAFEWLLSPDARLGFNATKAYSLAALARECAALGRTDEARKRYQELFEFWKAADQDLPLLVRARAEYAKLGS
jgi:tetratricopeptide (TPR) repeat protein/tRNA A-37 threonylcarbamoyl transferase component Bud32